MLKRYLAAICVVGAISGTASAEEPKKEKFTTSQVASGADGAVAKVASCDTAEPCASSGKNSRARAAMALLFLGIKNNCGQRPCAIRLAASR